MKQKINVQDIKKGDLIRAEFYSHPYDGLRQEPRVTSQEYWAGGEEDPHTTLVLAEYYLLERPEPPFEPHWGMAIREEGTVNIAYYLPEDVGRPGSEWILETRNYMTYQDNNWAKQKLAEGWVVIEKPED